MAQEVGHPKSELGEPGIVALVSMGGTCLTASNNKIVEEMAEMGDLQWKIVMVPPSLEVLRAYLQRIC